MQKATLEEAGPILKFFEDMSKEELCELRKSGALAELVTAGRSKRISPDARDKIRGALGLLPRTLSLSACKHPLFELVKENIFVPECKKYTPITCFFGMKSGVMYDTHLLHDNRLWPGKEKIALSAYEACVESGDLRLDTKSAVEAIIGKSLPGDGAKEWLLESDKLMALPQVQSLLLRDDAGEGLLLGQRPDNVYKDGKNFFLVRGPEDTVISVCVGRSGDFKLKWSVTKQDGLGGIGPYFHHGDYFWVPS